MALCSVAALRAGSRLSWRCDGWSINNIKLFVSDSGLYDRQIALFQRVLTGLLSCTILARQSHRYEAKTLTILSNSIRFRAVATILLEELIKIRKQLNFTVVMSCIVHRNKYHRLTYDLHRPTAGDISAVKASTHFCTLFGFNDIQHKTLYYNGFEMFGRAY